MRLLKRIIHTLKNYKTIYIAVDIHETVLKPTWNKTLSTKFYPFAQKTLQLMSKRTDIVLIMWTSCNTQDSILYNEFFKSYNIQFNYINQNPECKNTEYADFSSKMYFDVGLDDRFGFIPYIDWFILFIYFKLTK